MNIKSTIKAVIPHFLQPVIARIETSPLGYRLARGAFWSLFGAILSRGLGLASSILVARMLGKSGFGELGVIQSTVGMFGTFAGFGLGMTATKFIAQYRTIDPIKAGHIRALSSVFALVTSGTVSLVLFFLAPWLAEHSLGEPKLAKLLQIGTIFLFFTAINSAQIGALSGFEAYKTVAKISLLSGLLNFPLMVGGVYLYSIEGAVWGMGIVAGSNWLLNHIAIQKECEKSGIPYTYKSCWKEKRILWKFALPAVISGLFMGPTEWAMNAILVNQDGGYAQMGVFNAAKQWGVIILYLPGLLSNMTLPILSNLLGEKKIEQYKKMVVVNSLVLTAFAMVAAIPISFLSTTIMNAYGEGFSEGGGVLFIVSFYSVFFAANIVIGQVLWSTGASVLAMILGALRCLILFCVFLFVMPKTAFGMALSYLITYVIQFVYQYLIVFKFLKF